MLLKGKEMAYLGVLLGLNQIFIILSSIIETNTIILMSAAALIIGVVITEFGLKNGVVFYIASCILGFILTFNKTEIIPYIIFYGMYSIIKHIVETKITNKIIEYLFKFSYFTISMILSYVLVKLFVTINIAWWMVVVAEVLFLIYDYAFTVFINYYMDNLRPKLKL